MGKKQHQQDKMYLTTKEWAVLYGGKKHNSKFKIKRLPYNCCCISFLPFSIPYCTREGAVFDLENIVPFLKKHGVNPVTGAPMTSKQLIKLVYHKNARGNHHCPIMCKEFNENTRIVAIATSGNVFSWEAVQQLNIKARNHTDLLSGAAFDPKRDIIVLQRGSKKSGENVGDNECDDDVCDDNDNVQMDISQFYHVKKSAEEKAVAEQHREGGHFANLRAANLQTQDVLETLRKNYTPPASSLSSSSQQQQKFQNNTAHYSTGSVSASLTSTCADVATKIEHAVLPEAAVRYKYVRGSAFVRLMTNFGPLNLELFAEAVPKTCENFVRHCASGYFVETVFHRLVHQFVLQGGDPTGSGRGGKSIFEEGVAFEDEFVRGLRHDARGIVSMANSGPNTNTSQFFILLRPAPQLDRKHTVFGKLVGGIETINAIESVQTDKDDRPLEPITITATEIFRDPFEIADQEILKEREMEKLDRENLRTQNERRADKEDELPEFGNRREEEEFHRMRLLRKQKDKQQPESAANKQTSGGGTSMSAVGRYLPPSKPIRNAAGSATTTHKLLGAANNQKLRKNNFSMFD